MGLFKKKIVKKTYDREHMKPVIRASICTGEEVAGFKDIRTGKIEEIMLIRSPEELERFKEIYEITEEISKRILEIFWFVDERQVFVCKLIGKTELFYKGDMMKITYINHSGFLIETKDCYYIFDYYKG